MRNILFLHTILDVGGAEVMRLSLLRNIDRKRYNIKLCCIGEKKLLGKEIEQLGYRVDELKENPASLNIGITYRLMKYLKAEKPDILHSSLFNANFHARIAGLLCRIPHIITEEHGEHRQYEGIKFFPYILADFMLSRLNDYIVCCSDRLRDDIIKKERLPRSKVITIENCLDQAMYRPRLGREEIRKRYNISDELIFITAASLKAGKGHDYLIDVFREIKDRGYHFRCFFAGSGPLKELLQERCSESGLSKEIIFLGNVENITDYLNASDVFILPSFSEGLSISLMEAMFTGLPSIVTDVGSNPDLIKTGFNGTVVMPGDKEDLRKTIIFYLENKDSVRDYGKRSRSIIEARYSSMDRYVKEYYGLWDRCCNGEI